MPANRHRDYGPAILLTGAALLLRAVVLLWRAHHDPLFHEPLNDAAHYDAWAQALAAGLGFGPAGAPYYMSPLYPRLLVLLQGLGGAWGPTIFQALCGAATVFGIHDMGRRLYGARAGLWAGGLALFFAPPLWFESWLLPTTLNLFLLVMILDLAVACRQRGDDRRLLPWLGLLLGLAIINRPQHLLLLAGVLVWRGWASRRQPVTALVPLLLIVLGAAVVIAPVTLRNIRVSGEPVLVSANGGLNFYLGNFAGATGRFELPPDFPPDITRQQEASRRLARAGAGRALDWQGVSSYWFGRGVRELTDDPIGALKLYARKLRLTVAWREMEHNFLTSWVHRHIGPGRWLISSLGLLWLLAIPGLIAAVRERRAEVAPLLLLMGTSLLTCLLFWVNTRHRLPLMIPLTVFAGAAMATPRLWLSRAVLATLLLASVAVFWPTGDHEGASFHASLGRVYAQRGEFADARGAYEDALALQPGLPQARNGIALTYMEEGDGETAEHLLRELLADHPDYQLARHNLDLVLQHRDRP